VLLGYARALARGPDIDWQYAQLHAAGVTDRYIYADALGTRRSDPRHMFGEVSRALRGGDVLVVPCLGVFARNRAEVINSMQGLDLRRVAFVSVDDEIDTRQADADLLFKLGTALTAAERIWNRERTVNATERARRVGRNGRRPKLGPKREADARALWLDPESEKTNDEVAALVGLSKSRLHAKFGARPRAA